MSRAFAPRHPGDQKHTNACSGWQASGPSDLAALEADPAVVVALTLRALWQPHEAREAVAAQPLRALVRRDPAIFPLARRRQPARPASPGRHALPCSQRSVWKSHTLVIGVSTRKYRRSLEKVPADVVERGTSKSAVSRRFVAATGKKLMIDGLVIDLKNLAGAELRLRWRFVSDDQKFHEASWQLRGLRLRQATYMCDQP